MYRSYELKNEDYQLINNSAELMNSEYENQVNIAFNLIFDKRGLDEGLNLLYGSVNENNIDNLCNVIRKYKDGIPKILRFVESLYINEVYRVAQIEYKTIKEVYIGIKEGTSNNGAILIFRRYQYAVQ